MVGCPQIASTGPPALCQGVTDGARRTPSALLTVLGWLAEPLGRLSGGGAAFDLGCLCDGQGGPKGGGGQAPAGGTEEGSCAQRGCLAAGSAFRLESRWQLPPVGRGAAAVEQGTHQAGL